MGDLLLPYVAGMRGESMVEGFAVNILGMVREVVADGRGKIDIGAIWHGETLAMPDRSPLMRVKQTGCNEDQR